jgi:hypothetical protein
MGTEDPQNPNPDELNEDSRTGDEPNPSGKSPREKREPNSAESHRQPGARPGRVNRGR